MKLRSFRPQRFIPLLLSVLSLAIVPSSAKASLIVTSVANGISSYSATVNWIASTGGFTVESLGCADASPIALGCNPWRVFSLNATQSGLAGLGFLSLNIQHMVGPHPEDVNPGDAGTLNIINVSPGVGNSSTSSILVHTPHWDNVTLTVEAISTGLSRITITADHMTVPEPSTLALGALGGSLLLIGRRFRRRLS